MAEIINGKEIARIKREEIKTETMNLIDKTGVIPHLVVIQVGENPASTVYVRNKHRACLEVGFKSTTCTLGEKTTEEQLLARITDYNEDSSVHGILVQLPLPAHINEKKILNHILPNKDVDGFHPYQVGLLSIGDETLEPCTAAGVIELIKETGLEIAGQRAVIVGRSNIVGKPLINLLLNNDASVSVCHSKTKNLKEYTLHADILIVAIGRESFITADMVKPGAVVIDVGINRTTEGKLVGDVDFEKVSKVASHITPVPGGVGPMTIAMLLRNTLKAAQQSIDE